MRGAAVAIMAVLLITLYSLTAPYGLTWSHGGADGGELVTASFHAGIAHPPGYGLYTALGAIFTHLPFQSLNPAQRMQLLSHLAAALAAVAVGLSAALTASSLWPTLSDAKRVLIGLCAAGFLALSQTFWTQAIIVEVYSINGLLLALILLCLLRMQVSPKSWIVWLLYGHLYGLAVTHHLTALLWLPGILVLMYTAAQWRRLMLAFLGALSGLWPYLWLWVRAGQSPYANWGGIESGFDAFWSHITGQEYRLYLQSTPTTIAEGIGRVGQLMLSEWTVIGVMLVVVGLAVLMRHRQTRALALASMLWVAANVIFAGFYAAPNTLPATLLPSSVIAALWASLGVIRLTLRFTTFVTGISVIGLILALFVVNLPQVNRHGEDTVAQYINEALASTPDDTILLVYEDQDTFALWYACYVERRCEDRIIVNNRLMDRFWYRKSLAMLTTDVFPAPEADAGRWLLSLYSGPRPLAMTTDTSAPPGWQKTQQGRWTLLTPD